LYSPEESQSAEVAAVARVVGQIVHRPKRVSVIWAQGGASFEPYHLEGAALETLYDVARKARERLAAAVASHSDQAAADLALLGHQLYRLLFQLDATTRAAQSAHAWWQDLVQKNAVTSLELTTDRPGCVPWNLVCDQTPDGSATQHFWGFRFPMGVGRRVNPLRVFPYLDKPTLLVALNSAVENQLSGDLRQQLDQLLAERSAELVHSWDDLIDRIEHQGPDVLAILSRVERGRILMGERAGELRELRQTLSAIESGNPHPLALLLGSGTPDMTASWECFLGAATSELSNVIASDVPGQPEMNLRAGLAWLTRFLSAQADAGTALQQSRQQLGLAGLAFSAFCPPYVRVLEEGKEPDPELPTPTLLDLPAEPYRPLAPFDREDRALFIGREDETVRFARLLDDAGTRGVFLQGAAGVGKASFIRAGVLPYLEDEAVGYVALRDRSDLSQTVAERDQPTLSIRASSDLVGQLAEAFSAFCAQPFTYATPTGETVTVDLPAILGKHTSGSAAAPSDAIQAEAPAASPRETGIAVVPAKPSVGSGAATPVQLWQAFVDDPGALGRLLDDFTERLPFELLIVIEHGEDLLTQPSTTAEQERRQTAIHMLASLALSSARCKVILTLRSEFFGQLGEAFSGAKERPAWRDVYLAPLDRKALTETLLAPTATEPTLYALAAPHTRYGFAFAPGVVDEIVEDAVALAPAQGVAAATLAQTACAFLVADARERRMPVVQLAQLRELRGEKQKRIDLALDRYVERVINRTRLSRVARNSLRGLLAKLFRRDATGALTRPLFAARELAPFWTGGNTLENAVNAADAARLVQMQQLLIDGREGLHVSLAHDGLAAWGARQEAAGQRRQYARSRVVDALYVLLPLIVLAAALSFYLTRRFGGQATDEEDGVQKMREVAARLYSESQAAAGPLYAGALSQADQALKAGNLLRARQLLLGQQSVDERPFSEARIDRRGFEWHYLWRLANPERQTLLGHRGLVNAVAASADNALLATAGADGAVRLWNLKRQGEVAAILSGHQGAVHAVAFAPDSKSLASAGADGAVRLWEVKVGEDEPVAMKEARKVLTAHEGPVHALAFGKDNGALISGGADKTIIVWDIAAGKAKTTLKDHSAAVQAAAFAPDGKRFASGSADGTVIVWDADGAKKVQTLKTPGPVAGLAFASDGGALVAASNESQAGMDAGVVRVWDPATGKEIAGPLSAGVGVFGVACKPKSTVVIAASKDFAVRAWDYKTGKEQRTWQGHLGWVRAVAITFDGATLATSSYDNTVKLWDWTPPSDVLSHGAAVQAVAISGDDQLLASGGEDGVVKVWDLPSGALLGEIKDQPGPVTSLAFVPDNKERKLAVGSFADKGAGSVKLWDVTVALGKLVAKEGPAFEGHTKGVLCLAFAKDKTLATGGADGTAILWDIATGKKKLTLNAEQPVQSVAFSPSGARLATGDRVGVVRVWNTANGDLIRRGGAKEVGAHESVVHALAMLSDDFDFLSAGADHLVKQWSWKENKNPSARLVSRAHHQPVSCLVLLGPTAFATGSIDRTVKLWDRRDGGEERFTLLGHSGAIRALAAANNRQLLASAGQDGVVRLWRASPPLLPTK
jgi:WD40 repeat protein